MRGELESVLLLVGKLEVLGYVLLYLPRVWLTGDTVILSKTSGEGTLGY